MAIQGERMLTMRPGRLPAVAMAVAGGFAALAFAGSNEPLAAISAVTGALGASLAFRMRPIERLVEVDERGVLVDRKLAIPRAAVRSARVLPRFNQASAVRIDAGPLRSLTIQPTAPPDEPPDERARAIVRALGQDVTQVLAHFWTRSPLATPGRIFFALTLAGALAFVLAVACSASPIPYVLIPMIFALTALLMLLPRRVTVGRDGVLLDFLGTATFICVDRISAVELSANGVLVEETLGERHEIITRLDSAYQDDKRELIAERIREILHERDRRRTERTAPTALLARGDRSVGAWAEHLRGLVSGGGYRASLSPGDLWRLLEDSAAGRSERAGAAVALSKLADDGTRERLRVVAETTAEPRVRVAILCAAEEDEAGLQRALAALDAGE